MKCPMCESDNTIKDGPEDKEAKTVRRYCRDCHRTYTITIEAQEQSDAKYVLSIIIAILELQLGLYKSGCNASFNDAACMRKCTSSYGCDMESRCKSHRAQADYIKEIRELVK